VQAVTPAPHGDLDAEQQVIQSARTQMARKDFDAALRAIEAHERQFPHGQLIEERDALRIQCLVAAGYHPEARRLAASFHKRFPHSLLMPAIDQSIRSIP
jgi:hypothetical protein